MTHHSRLVHTSTFFTASSPGGWNGYVQINYAAPCPGGANIQINAHFTDAKDGQDALEKVKSEIEKADKEAHRIKEECERQSGK